MGKNNSVIMNSVTWTNIINNEYIYLWIDWLNRYLAGKIYFGGKVD